MCDDAFGRRPVCMMDSLRLPGGLNKSSTWPSWEGENSTGYALPANSDAAGAQGGWCSVQDRQARSITEQTINPSPIKVWVIYIVKRPNRSMLETASGMPYHMLWGLLHLTSGYTIMTTERERCCRAAELSLRVCHAHRRRVRTAAARRSITVLARKRAMLRLRKDRG